MPKPFANQEFEEPKQKKHEAQEKRRRTFLAVSIISSLVLGTFAYETYLASETPAIDLKVDLQSSTHQRSYSSEESRFELVQQLQRKIEDLQYDLIEAKRKLYEYRLNLFNIHDPKDKKTIAQLKEKLLTLDIAIEYLENHLAEEKKKNIALEIGLEDLGLALSQQTKVMEEQNFYAVLDSLALYQHILEAHHIASRYNEKEFNSVISGLYSLLHSTGLASLQNYQYQQNLLETLQANQELLEIHHIVGDYKEKESAALMASLYELWLTENSFLPQHDPVRQQLFDTIIAQKDLLDVHFIASYYSENHDAHQMANIYDQLQANELAYSYYLEEEKRFAHELALKLRKSEELASREKRARQEVEEELALQRLELNQTLYTLEITKQDLASHASTLAKNDELQRELDIHQNLISQELERLESLSAILEVERLITDASLKQYTEKLNSETAVSQLLYQDLVDTTDILTAYEENHLHLQNQIAEKERDYLSQKTELLSLIKQLDYLETMLKNQQEQAQYFKDKLNSEQALSQMLFHDYYQAVELIKKYQLQLEPTEEGRILPVASKTL